MQEKQDADRMSKGKTNIPDYLNSSRGKTKMPDHFNSSNNKEADKRVNEAITNRIHNEFYSLFSGTTCLEGTFFMQVKDGSCPYQAPPRRVAYALQKPLKEELKWIQKKQIIVQLCVDETSESCNSFVLVPKANGKGQPMPR